MGWSESRSANNGPFRRSRYPVRYWATPDAGHEAAATAHLSADGVHYQNVGGLPPEVEARITGRLGTRTGA